MSNGYGKNRGNNEKKRLLNWFQNRLVSEQALGKPAKSPVFLSNSRKLFQKLKFWNSLNCKKLTFFAGFSFSRKNRHGSCLFKHGGECHAEQGFPAF
jgi:hypothetical protein